MDSGFVSNKTEESVALRLEDGERVRHLGPHRLHGKGGIDSDEYSPGMAREVQVVGTAQHAIQRRTPHTRAETVSWQPPLHLSIQQRANFVGNVPSHRHSGWLPH